MTDTEHKIIYRKLYPGQPGTKQLLKTYGEKLVCLRYRYDTKTRVKYKTIELIVDSGCWEKKPKIAGNKKVEVRIEYNEQDLRRLTKAAGGIWNYDKKVWELGLKEVKRLGLEERIIR